MRHAGVYLDYAVGATVARFFMRAPRCAAALFDIAGIFYASFDADIRYAARVLRHAAIGSARYMLRVRGKDSSARAAYAMRAVQMMIYDARVR